MSCDQVLCQPSTSNVPFHPSNHVWSHEWPRMYYDRIEWHRSAQSIKCFAACLNFTVISNFWIIFEQQIRFVSSGVSPLGARSSRAFRSRGGNGHARCDARCVARCDARCDARWVFSRFCSFFPETGTVSLLGLGALFRIRLLDADHTCSGVWSWAVHRLCMLSGVFFELRPFAIFFEFLNGPTPPFSFGSSPLFWCPRVFFCAEAFLGGVWSGAIHALVVSVR